MTRSPRLRYLWGEDGDSSSGKRTFDAERDNIHHVIVGRNADRLTDSCFVLFHCLS